MINRKSIGILLLVLIVIPVFAAELGNTRLEVARAYAWDGAQYSGIVVRVKASDIGRIVGVKPDSVLAAAYTSSGWIRLPIRIYDAVIHNNMTTIYVMPERIGPNTMIEVKLPPTPTLQVKPEEDMPRFLRGGDGYIHLTINDDRLEGAAHLYLFYDKRDRGHVYWSSAGYQYLYNVDYAHIADPFETELAPAKPSRGPGALIVEATRSNMEVEAYDNPLPDGSGAPAYSLVELRAQHTIYHLEQDLTLGYYASETYTFVQVLDPAASAGVSWTRVRLTILATPLKAAPTPLYRIMEVKVLDTGEVKTFTVYTYKSNVIVTDIILNLYGSTNDTVWLKIKLYGINSPSERWNIRLLSTAYLTWTNMPFDGPREKSYNISLIDDAEITVTLSPWDRDEERQIYLKNTRILSIVNQENINTIISVSSLADPQAYPLRASIYLDSVRLCSVTLYQPLEEGLCSASIDPNMLAAIFSRDTPIPVTVRVVSYSNSYFNVKLYLDTVKPLEIESRQMYLSVVDGYRIVFTSTIDDYNLEWLGRSRIMMGGGLGSWALSQGSLLEGFVEARLSWDIVFEYQLSELELGIDYYGVPSKTICDASLNCYRVEPIKIDKVEATLYLNGVQVNPLSVDVLGVGEQEGSIPSIPKIPPMLGMVLSRFTFSQLYYVYQAYNAVAWTLDRLAEKLLDSVKVSVDEASKMVRVIWSAGLLGSKDALPLKITVDIVPESAQAECREQVAVVKLYSGNNVYEKTVRGMLCPFRD